ncbi:MAG: hypothetical protein QNK20_07840 [Aureibaculum sp.]|nr:hypothetical protein [Aureibaculum sp.]
MNKLINKFLLAIFALSLIGISTEMYLYYKNGFDEEKELWYQILVIFFLFSLSLYFLNLFYRTSISKKP